MAGSDRPPEQLIRDWLEKHGTVTVGVAAIEETWGVERLGARERRDISRALESVGVKVEPSLKRVGPGDEIALSLRPQEPRTAAPWLAAIAVGLMVVGSLGPWAGELYATDYGLDRDGAFVIAAGALAAMVLFAHARLGRPGLALLASALGAVAIGILASEFRDAIDDTFVKPAWGLYAAAVGSALLVALSMSLLVRRG